MSKSVRARLMASSMIGGLAIFAAPVAFAADATSSPLATDSGANASASAASPIQTLTQATTPPVGTTNPDASGQVAEVVVTGSRIPQPNLTAISPVQTTSGNVVKFSGAVNTVDVLDSLPQVAPSFGQFESNGSTGTATVDLRGLGANRTLVLINGLRVGGQDPTEVAAYVPDVNFIPPTLIDRVDVLTGGASAVYGSDAVSGVVNFVMKTNYEGLQVDGQVSAFEYDGGTPGQITAANARGVNSLGFNPQHFNNSPVMDGENYNLNIIGGTNSGDGKGNVEFYLGYTEIRAVLEAARPYMQCGLSTNSSNTKQQYCGGSANDAYGILEPTAVNGVPIPSTSPSHGAFNITGTPAGGLLPGFAYNQAYNFAPLNYIQRPDQRYTGGEFSHYEIAPWLDLYTSFMFMDDDSVAQIAPSGSFLGDVHFDIPCNDPLLSAAQANTLCGASAGTASIANASIGRRDVEGGNRTQTTQHLDFRFVVGGRGDIGDGWHYDVSDEFSRSVLTESEGGYFSNSKLLNAVDVETDAANGKPECAVYISGTDTNCVPYNIWSPGGVTNAALKYLEETASMSGSTQQNDLLATVSNGDLSRYGLKSPWASDPMGVSAGVEWKIDQLTTDYDTAYQSGDLAGFGGSFSNTSGAQGDGDLFAELHVPIIQDMPLAKDFSADLGYRLSDYTYGGTNSTYKIGFDYAPDSDIRFRTSYERAVRAPNVLELFEPDTPGLFAGQDPCAYNLFTGAPPALTAAQCYNTVKNTLAKDHITMSEATFASTYYGNTPQCPAAQCGVFAGGNTGLKPEEADTVSVGFVLTPSFVHNLSITVDFFNIVVNNAIVALPAETLVTNCGRLDSAFDCAEISRDPNDLYALYGGEGAGSVSTPLVNASKLSTDGVDVQGDYRIRLEDLGVQDKGSLDFNFNGTYTATLTTFLPDGTGFDCVGLYGVTCGIPTPKWRHDMRVTWETPWNLQLSANWRFIGSSSLDFNTNVPDLQDGAYKDSFPTDAHIPIYNYLDLSFKYRVNDKVSLRGGVNNVLDTIPPLLDSNSFGISAPPFGNGNTYPQLYDPLGRYMFIGFTADL